MTTTLRFGDCKQEDIDAHEACLVEDNDKTEDDKAKVDKVEADDYDDDDDIDFTTPPTRRTKTAAGKVAKVTVDPEGEGDGVPRGWISSGTMVKIVSRVDTEWVRHEKVWRDKNSNLVLQSGTTFSLGTRSDFTKCDVLVLAIGVFRQVSNPKRVSRRVTALCSFKKDGLEWDTPQFHSAASIIDCAVALDLDFRSLKGVQPFTEEAVAEMITEESGRETKNSSALWMELQSPPTAPKTSPKTSKRSRSGTEQIDTLKPAKITKAPTRRVP